MHTNVCINKFRIDAYIYMYISAISYPVHFLGCFRNVSDSTHGCLLHGKDKFQCRIYGILQGDLRESRDLHANVFLHAFTFRYTSTQASREDENTVSDIHAPPETRMLLPRNMHKRSQ